MASDYKHGIYTVVVGNLRIIVKGTSPPSEKPSSATILKTADGLLLKTADGFYLAAVEQ